MRAKITINNLSGLPINYDYQYGLASMLYHKLAKADIHLANEMHSKKGFKFYTFSHIMSDKVYKTDKEIK